MLLIESARRLVEAGPKNLCGLGDTIGRSDSRGRGGTDVGYASDPGMPERKKNPPKRRAVKAEFGKSTYSN
jgi:hypothetical protein